MAHTTPIGQTHLTTRLVPIALLIGLLSLLSLSAVGQVITSQHLGVTRFYYDWNNLQLVINEAFDGDTIMLPGASVNPAGDVQVNKPLTFVGAGVLSVGTPVTGVTRVIDQFGTRIRITGSGYGSNFHGIDFDREVGIDGIGAQPITFTRCEFGRLTLGDFDSDGANDVRIRQSILRNGIAFSGGNTVPTNIAIDNCIVDGGLNFGYGLCTNVYVTNCVLLGTDVSNSNPNKNEGVEFTRCIFTQSGGGFSLSNYAVYSSCLFASGSVVPPLTWTNAFDAGDNDAAPLFTPIVFTAVSMANAIDYNESSDYTLPAGSAAIDPNGIDRGIHDGVPGNGWKPNAIPFNPHWTSLPTSFGTTNGGLLNSVNIGGAAQQD